MVVRESGEDVPGQPQKTLGGGVLLLLDLVDDERLQRLAVAGLLDLAVAEFLPDGRRQPGSPILWLFRLSWFGIYVR